MSAHTPPHRTDGAGYTQRLSRLEQARWKRVLDVQAPYRWNVRRLCTGRVLDVGCGIGRNLAHLKGRAVGVDHNPSSVALAVQRGHVAFTPDAFEEWLGSNPAPFDTILLAHVLEHLSEAEARTLLRTHLPTLRPGGRLVLITPQERGWASDASHVRWVGRAELEATCLDLGLQRLRSGSFPLPRLAGRAFRHNEFFHVAISHGPGAAADGVPGQPSC